MGCGRSIRESDAGAEDLHFKFAPFWQLVIMMRWDIGSLSSSSFPRLQRTRLSDISGRICSGRTGTSTRLSDGLPISLSVRSVKLCLISEIWQALAPSIERSCCSCMEFTPVRRSARLPTCGASSSVASNYCRQTGGGLNNQPQAICDPVDAPMSTIDRASRVAAVAPPSALMS